jgi:hypothetical protein
MLRASLTHSRGSLLSRRVISGNDVARRLASSYQAAFDSIFEKSANPKVAFLGTGPMALSMASSIITRAKTEGVKSPKIVLLTEQQSYYDALKSSGYKVQP